MEKGAGELLRGEPLRQCLRLLQAQEILHTWCLVFFLQNYSFLFSFTTNICLQQKEMKPFQSLPSKIFLLCLELIACRVAVHGKLLQRMLMSSHIVMCWSIAAVS